MKSCQVSGDKIEPNYMRVVVLSVIRYTLLHMISSDLGEVEMSCSSHLTFHLVIGAISNDAHAPLYLMFHAI